MVRVRLSPALRLRLYWMLFFAAIAGCGGGTPKYPVHGKVTLPDGSPFVGAVVEFTAKEGINGAAGVVQSDGTYTLSSEGQDDGAPAGAYRVRLIPPDADETGNADDDDPGYQRRKRPQLPRKYQSIETSGLEFTVSDSGDNKFDIALSKD